MENIALPTVTLAPPPDLASSRSVHVKPIAAVPITISLLIVAVVAVYVGKLWHREDKFYIEELYSDDEHGDAETQYEEAAIKDLVTSTRVDGPAGNPGRPDTPESLILARKGILSPGTYANEARPVTPEIPSAAHLRGILSSAGAVIHIEHRRPSLSAKAREALSRPGGISSPFNAKKMPHDLKDPGWKRKLSQEQRRPRNNMEVIPPRNPAPVSIPSPPPPPPPRLASPPAVGTMVPTNDYPTSNRSTDTWEREISVPSPEVRPNQASPQPRSRSPTQDNHDHNNGGLPTPNTVNNTALRSSLRSEDPEVDSESTEIAITPSTIPRRSGIDWNDDDGSLISSNYTKFSDVGRSSYQDKWHDY